MSEPEIDTDRIDDAILALMQLGIHGLHRDFHVARAWKSFDWEAMDRLHAKGMISDPVGKAKSVVLTEEGLKRSEALFRELFIKRAEARG